jgi:hypothetical protein
MADLFCHACGESVTVDEPVPRDAECARCGADLRSCANCRHWDARYHNQCREPEAEPVDDRRRRNFCEFFSYSRAPFAGAAGGERAAAARAGLEALFGGKPAGAPAPAAPGPSEARARLEAMFRSPPPQQDDEE